MCVVSDHPPMRGIDGNDMGGANVVAKLGGRLHWVVFVIMWVDYVGACTTRNYTRINTTTK